MVPSSIEQLRFPVRYRALVTMLACMLLLANMALALHHYDLAAHQDVHTCEVCVSASGLDQALPGSTQAPVVSFHKFLTHVCGYSHAPHAADPYHARAPPVKNES